MSARKLIQRELSNGRMLKQNGSWLYCNNCNNTVGYLCYSTYDHFEYIAICKCGVTSSFTLTYEKTELKINTEPIKLVKNRYCCSNDDSPLFTIVSKNVESYKYSVVCKACKMAYISE